MKIDLNTMAKKRYIVENKDGGFYVPGKDYIVMSHDTIIAFIGYDADRGRWKAEDLGGSDSIYVSPNSKEFEVYKSVN